MMIRNETNLNAEVIIDYSTHLFLESQKKMLIGIPLVAVLISVYLFFYVNIIAAIITATIGFMIPLVVFYALRKIIKKKYEQMNPQNVEVKMCYSFYDQYFEAYPNGQSLNLYRCKFEEFMKIVETKRLFIFQKDETEAYYVSKKGFTEGTIFDLRELLGNVECFQQQRK